MKYRRKPVEIEAFKFDGDMMTSDGKYYVPEWAVNALNSNVLFFEDDGELYLRCEDGYIEHVYVGDYIILDVRGVLFVYEPDVFEKMYELVEE